MDREDQLRSIWHQMVADFQYRLSEYGYDAIQDGYPDDLKDLFGKLREELATLETIGFELAELVNKRLEAY